MYARCPQCARPAQIVDRFTLGSSDGPLEHVKLVCPGGGHWYTPPLEDVEILRVAPSAEQIQAWGARRAA